MKTTKLMRWAFFAAILAVFGLAGCEKLDLYSIDSPSDLQSRIDSIAAANASKNSGDTTFISLATTMVGANDYTSAWWSVWSDYFTIPTNKLLHLEFVNHTTCATTGQNYQNWVLVLANMKAHRTDATLDDGNTDYKEYCALRADAFGWGGAMAGVDAAYTYDAGYIKKDYPDIDGDGDVWNDFRSHMDGAYVTMDVDHSATGNVYVKASMVATDGTVLTETFQNGVSPTEDIIAFLACEISYMEMKKAYLIPSKVTEIADVNPVAIVITGTPTFVEIGNTNFWGAAKATVTYADASIAQVDSADLSFTVIPDMTTLGTKTVVVAYSKSKKGAYSKAISQYYTLDVTNPVSSLEITTLPNITSYYFYSSDSIPFNTTGVVVTATYSDGSKGILPNGSLKFGKIPAAEGSQNAVISYVGATKTVTTTCSFTLTKGIGQVGATDFSSGWWTAFSNEYNVASGSTKIFTMHCYSTGANNYNSPLTILRKADKTEFGVLRMDSYGWLYGNNSFANNDVLKWTLTSDWVWGTFAANINDSDIKITVTNVGNGTANVRYDVTYKSGETHFQQYENISVDSADLNCAITIDGCYAVITKVE